VADSPLAAPVVIEPGKGKQVRSIKGRRDESAHCVFVSGQKAPGQEHGPLLPSTPGQLAAAGGG
jgi:hypothetical protein